MGNERTRLTPFAASMRHKMHDTTRAALRANGQIPILINDCYLPHLFRPERIQILYGGRASGKSDVKATELLLKAVSQSFFRCVFVRKFKDTVRDSQFALFCDLIKRYGIDDLFRIKYSEMDIICKHNGNILMAGGLDNADKIKSTPDVTDVWIEEPIDKKGSITEADFIDVNLTVRCEKASNHIHLTFNPIAKENWIHRLFFEQKIYETFALKTTYRDNAFLPPDIEAQYEALRHTNPDEYRIYGLGEWGSMDDMAMRLFHDASIEDLFTNGGFLPDGERYITADVAFTGADQFVVMAWSGWKVLDVRVFARTEGDEVVGKIQAIANEFGVPGQRVAFDAGGVGIGLRGFLRSAVPFVGAASPIDDAAEKTDLQRKILPRPAFRNLRAQAYHFAAQKVNDCEAAFMPKSVHLQTVLAQELRAIRRMDLPDGGKYQIIPKEEIKDRIGRSPDYADCFSMRAVFDLQNHKQRRARQMRAG